MQLGWGAAGMGVPSPQPRGRAGTGRGSGPPSEPLQIRPFSAFPPPRPPPVSCPGRWSQGLNGRLGAAQKGQGTSGQGQGVEWRGWGGQPGFAMLGAYLQHPCLLTVGSPWGLR